MKKIKTVLAHVIFWGTISFIIVGGVRSIVIDWNLNLFIACFIFPAIVISLFLWSIGYLSKRKEEREDEKEHNQRWE